MKLLELSCRAYSLLLPLYTSRLRFEFGEEMTHVFADQVRDECRESGLAGLARVWWQVAVEVLEGALPTEVDWAKVGIPVASLTSAFVGFLIFFWTSGIAQRCAK